MTRRMPFYTPALGLPNPTTSPTSAVPAVPPVLDQGVPSPGDFAAVARRVALEEFIGRHPYPFLIGTCRFAPAGSNASTMPGGVVLVEDRPARLVLGVRKVQAAFPSMVTVGRTSNNDLVLSDPTVSKVHAWFRVAGALVVLGDAGSQNGTWVDGVPLVPKGPPAEVPFGVVVRFGRVELTLHDAASAWQVLHADSPSR